MVESYPIHKPKAIIFDIGGVLVRANWQRFFKSCGFSTPPKGEYPFDHSLKLLHFSFMRGELTVEAFSKKVIVDYQLQISFEEFKENWISVLEPIEKNISIARCMSKHMPIFILSDTDELHFTFQFLTFCFNDFVTSSVLSYKYGYLKPRKEIFDVAINEFGFSANNYLFIDDKIENVLSARKRGISSILYKNTKSLTKILVSLSK